jgi:hypothetical protein
LQLTPLGPHLGSRKSNPKSLASESMRVVKLLVVAMSTALAGCASSARAPSETGTSALRAQVLQAFASASHRTLPQGDTLITWNGPGTVILFTTVDRSPDGVYSSLVRNDGLNGTARSSWAEASLRTTEVVWTRPDSVVLELTLEVRGAEVIVTGTRDTVLVAPTEPWAAADYGMEDQLLPLISRLPVGETNISVLRPFQLRWDRLSVTITRGVSLTSVTTRGSPAPESRWDLGRSGALLRISSEDSPQVERRPLEGSALHAEYVDLFNSGVVR